MSSRLPPPPAFTLPPPPMPPADMFDSKIVSQLTCSLIRHQQQMTNSRLILIGTALVISAILLFVISLAWLLACRRRYERKNDFKPSPPPVTSIDSMNDLSSCSSRSYETISSQHTGVYLESVDTSATTCSTEPSSIYCYECHHDHGLQVAPYYHVIGMPDLLPS